MEINRVVPSGYCKGVVNAIKLAKDTKNKYPNTPIYILGMIVHNTYVTKELENLGIKTLDDSKTSKEELLDQIDNGIVIFTAHGISDSIKNKAIQKGLQIVDATCVDVLKTRNTIVEYINSGYDVLYFGKKNHPEADAIVSISDKIHLITSQSDIENFTIQNPKIFMTNQTTMSYLQLEDLIACCKKKFPNIVIEKEICNATSSRQLAIKNIQDCDLLYVVGDTKSNNTNKLVEIAQCNNIQKVKLIQSYHDIDNNDLLDVKKIYVTAGASTPPILINEVIEYLKRFNASTLK